MLGTTIGKANSVCQNVWLSLALKILACLFLVPVIGGQAQTSSFSCPDSSEKQACDSYSELVQAGDKGVTGGDVKYVCFRDHADEFFVIDVRDPFLSPWELYEWNKKLARYTLKNWQQIPKPQSYSSIQTYGGGVENDSTIPSIFVLGSWTYFGFAANNELTYRAQPTISEPKTGKQVPDLSTFLSVNSDQVEFFQAYTSVTKQKVQYSFVLQRWTAYANRSVLIDRVLGTCRRVRDGWRHQFGPAVTHSRDQRARRTAVHGSSCERRDP